MIQPTLLPVSAVILAQEDGPDLRRCIASLADFDEVLIYSNGPGEIAGGDRVRVIKGHFDGFGPTRNRAAELARHDWIFNIDSDEWLKPELQASLRALQLNDPKLIYTLNRRNLMFGHVPRSIYGWELIHRLYHRRHTGWTGKVHESIGPLDGSPMRMQHLKGELWHDPYRSVGHLFQKRWIYAQPELRDRLKAQHPALASLRGLWRFVRCYLIQLGFIDGWRGFVVSVADAYGTFLKYAWAYAEKHRKEAPRG